MNLPSNNTLVPTRKGEAPLLAAQRGRSAEMKMGARTLLVFLVLVASGSHGTTIAVTYPVHLNKADREIIERLACTEPHRVPMQGLVAQAYDKDEQHVSAEATCQSHGEFRGKPMRHIGQCNREASSWSCSGSNVEILMNLGSTEAALRFRDVDADFAYETVQKLEGAGWLKRGTTTGESKPTCFVDKGPVPEWFVIRCLGWMVTVSSWCPQDDCPRVVSAHEVWY